MIYQKASTGFRIGASVGIIILMLGIAISVSVSDNLMISDKTSIITNYDEPLEKSFVQASDIQKNQESILNDGLKFLQEKDSYGFQSIKDQFFVSENLKLNELEQSQHLIEMAANSPQSGYLDPNPALTMTKIEEIKNLSAKYDQSALEFFQVSDASAKPKLDGIVNDLHDKEEALDQKQTSLLKDVESSNRNIETTIDQFRQQFVAFDVIIISSVGIISMASGHFVNQIKKDLIQEVFKKTNHLQRANVKLKKMNTLKDDFINEASHELKSPLNPIYGFVEMAKNGDIDKEEALNGIAAQARQIEEVANKMLDLGKIDNQRLRLFIEKFDLNQLISEIVTASRINLKESQTITTCLCGNLEVEADRIRIGQVIRNILNNAIKFTDAGRISITSINSGTDAKVEVSDTGVGISYDLVPRLFDKFATGGIKDKNIDGSGLGLYISKGIIGAHMGNISAHNNSDCGATFSFSIPLIHPMDDSRIYEIMTG